MANLTNRRNGAFPTKRVKVTFQATVENGLELGALTVRYTQRSDGKVLSSVKHDRGFGGHSILKDWTNLDDLVACLVRKYPDATVTPETLR